MRKAAGSLALFGEDTEFCGSGNGLALVVDIQFAIDVVGVLLNGARGDVQPGGDFFDAQPFGQQFQDFKLAVGQRYIDLIQVAKLSEGDRLTLETQQSVCRYTRLSPHPSADRGIAVWKQVPAFPGLVPQM